MESCTFSSRHQQLCEPLYIDTNINYNLDLSLFPGMEDPVKRLQPQLLIHGPQTCSCFNQYSRYVPPSTFRATQQPADLCCCQDCSFRDTVSSSHYYAASTRQQTTCYESCNQCIDIRNEQVVPSFPENFPDNRSERSTETEYYEKSTDQFLLSPWELSFLIDDVTKDTSGTDQDLDMYLCAGKRKSTSDQDEVPSKRVRMDECSDNLFYNSPSYYSSGLEMIRGV